jgi:MoaA/NifB/PqqE/SkfB family radical SAM enzyme
MELIKKTINNPNLSIILPGNCNAKCDFCFWENVKVDSNYLTTVKQHLDKLPSQFNQLSLTGGEPTLSPMFVSILKLIDKSKYNKVILTTNGSNILKHVKNIENIVDHVNISRHHYTDSINNDVFKTNTIPDKNSLISIINELNKIGIDVTLSAVLSKKLSTKDDIVNYINFTKEVGAYAVFFRKPHGNILPSSTEALFSEYKSNVHGCPVCRYNKQIINGISVTWKCSVSEPSDDLDEIYEAVIHQNGNMTEDWKGLKPIDFSLKSTVKSLKKERIIQKQIVESSCGSSGCGSSYRRNYNGCGGYSSISSC